MGAGPMVQVTDVDDAAVGRVTSTGFLLFLNGIILFLALSPWVAIVVGGYLWTDGNHTAALSLIGVGAVGVALLMFPSSTFPEWPCNRWMCRRLLRAIRKRRRSIVSPNDPEARIVDLIPKSNWHTVKLENAVDIMLVRVTREALLMEGDRKRYQIPAQAIARCYVETMRPSGWMVDHFCVMLTVRTGHGLRELPLFVRDFRFGEISVTARKDITEELKNAIDAIASEFYVEEVVQTFSEDEDDMSLPYQQAR